MVPKYVGRTRCPRWWVKAFGYGSDCARVSRSMSSAGQVQSIRLSSMDRLWKKLALDLSCLARSVRPAAISPDCPL